MKLSTWSILMSMVYIYWKFEDLLCLCTCRRELRRKGKDKVPLKSRDWVLAKKQRKRNQGRYDIVVKSLIQPYLSSSHNAVCAGMYAQIQSIPEEREDQSFKPFLCTKFTDSHPHSDLATIDVQCSVCTCSIYAGHTPQCDATVLILQTFE